MALWYEKEWSHGYQLGIWKLEEDEAFFQKKLELQKVEEEELSRIKGRRRLEWLASRYLIHALLSDMPEWDRIPLVKDEFGKPHLHGSLLDLSFSHSSEFVAVIISKMKVGIDIQRFVPKITLLERKFMRAEESGSLEEKTRLEHLHFYWGAKEALYKAYGRKLLDWKENMLVEPFDYQEVGQTRGVVTKGEFYQEYDIFFEKKGGYFLVYCFELNRGFSGAGGE
ncbi:MAG TPA: 4'-phosphopantetheinyl transferase superfamily protein [Bacteroidetes bacterium]|nr:4'-phosphopantetheinyl transferase superfamily protein [Bacteroidota bacterium]